MKHDLFLFINKLQHVCMGAYELSSKLHLFQVVAAQNWPNNLWADDVIDTDQIVWHMSPPQWRKSNPLHLLGAENFA